MLTHWFKLSFRRLGADLNFTIINVLGLSFGLATSALVLMYVQDELTADQFHSNSDQIFRITREIKGGAFRVGTPVALSGALSEELPGVENTMRSGFGGSRVIVNDEGEFTYEEEFHEMDPSIFQLFDFDLEVGNKATALNDVNSVVVSKYIAKKYFGDMPPVGKAITIDDKDYMITGVLADIPSNSSFQFNFISNYQRLLSENYPDESSWTNGSGYTFVLLQKGYDQGTFEQDLKRLVQKHAPGDSGTVYFVGPLKDMYFSEAAWSGSQYGGKIEYVYTFATAGFLVLLLAVANYINLSTAKAFELSKDVGVRRVVGAGRSQLIFQYVGESILLIVIVLAIATCIVEFTLPHLNTLTGKSITLHYFKYPHAAPILAGLALVIAVLSGIYPAILSSRIKIVSALKGTATLPGGSINLRKVLLGFQYAVSIGLIISTVVIGQQLTFMQREDLGFDKEQVVKIDLGFDREKLEKFPVLKEKYKMLPGILDVTGSPLPRMSGVGSDKDSLTGESITVYYMQVDKNFFDFYNIKFAERLDEGKPISTSDNIAFVNKAYTDRFGLSDPLGQEVTTLGDSGMIRRPIYGVTENFKFGGSKSTVGPLIINYTSYRVFYVDVRITTQNIQSTLEGLKQEWVSVFPGTPFQYEFMDEIFAKKYAKERQTSLLFRYFAVLGIVIACMGLFGVTMLVIKKKTKEIGIRRVFGARSVSLLYLLAKDFVIIFPIAFVISATLSYFYLTDWLSDFPSRIEPSIIDFAGAAFVLLVLSLVSISGSMLKASRTNPAILLRDE